MKRTEYIIKYHHHSDEDTLLSLQEILRMLKTLLPECDIGYEPCKSDFGILTVSFDEDIIE